MCRRRFSPRRRAPALALLLLPALPGCLIPYGLPEVSQTPLLSLGEAAGEVHAFRVDITRDFADISGTDRCTLREVAPWPGGWVFPQTKLSATYGFYVFGIALNYPVYVSHSLALKLYRPGYELVERDAWGPAGEVVWKKAADLPAQERALDHLFVMPAGGSANESATWPMIRVELAPGSESAGHRRVLLFGASEYERLASAAALGPEGDAVGRRLRAKAQKLRELAGEAVPLTGGSPWWGGAG